MSSEIKLGGGTPVESAGSVSEILKTNTPEKVDDGRYLDELLNRMKITKSSSASDIGWKIRKFSRHLKPADYAALKKYLRYRDTDPDFMKNSFLESVFAPSNVVGNVTKKVLEGTYDPKNRP